MTLYIDTSDAKKITIKLDDKIFETEAKKEKAQFLLPFIDETLKKEGKTIKDLTAIEVHTGPGSFTGLRVGVAVAQALAWSLKLPLNGKDIKQDQTIKIKYS